MNPIKEIYQNKIVAVIRAEDAKEATEKAKAMYDGGIRVFEITVEHSNVLPAIEYINNLQGAVAMAGGVITAMSAQEAVEHGAKLIVSPVFQLNLAKYCLGNKIPHIATVSTPNEAYNAWKSRIPIIKIFPAKPMGQSEYIEDILRPMPFLNLMPSGGISLDDFKTYLDAGAIAVGLGRCLYKDASLKEITERAQFVLNKLN